MQKLRLFKSYIKNKKFGKFVIFDIRQLADYTTIKAGGPAKCFIETPNLDILKDIFEFICKNNIEFNIIGNGSNLLISDKGFDGAVISIKNIPKRLYSEGNYLFVSGNIEVPHILKMCQEYQLSGLEFLNGIPGMIGGMVEMNAGAFDCSIGNVIKEIVIINENGELEKISSSFIQFGYRKINIKKKNYIIVEAIFKMKKESQKRIKDLCDKYYNNRSFRFLLDYCTFGSVFKNGEDYYAGELLDRCGLKGYRIGNAQIFEKHANFIINLGNATSYDIYKLIKKMKKEVLEKFNIVLEPEVRFWGDFSDA
ncbi:MAG: UDP-N-acetylmuramate dehydrogenase [Candidatus Cloacimonetes bacterium]|nr:UDP-N-acetylmuramate dehydrogenase [Candidatus Cloacimonadota bacterium]